MPITRITLAGGKGVNKDISAVELPEGAVDNFTWSNSDNMRFLDGYAVQFYGHGVVYESPLFTPYFLLPLMLEGGVYWVYAGASAIGCVGKNPTILHTDLSRVAGYTAAPNTWTGGVLGGIPILNNGTDTPQQWDTDVTHTFEELSNWPANTTCKALRVYKQFLIALNVTIAGVNYPYMVKWSHPAVPGAVPTSWDETDETVDAGQTDLAEGVGHIIDGLTLRGSFIIYREKKIEVMTYVGGNFVFDFTEMAGTSGIMNRNCVVEFDGYHFVLTDSDMLVHDGSTAAPILDKKVRRFVFRDMDSSARKNAFVMKNPFFNEIWVCYPSVGKVSCDKAVVWNYRDETISFKTLPNVFYGTFGEINEAITDPWSDDSDPWGADLSRWNDASNVPGKTRVIMASEDDELYLADAGGVVEAENVLPVALPFTLPKAGATPLSGFLERTGLTFGAPERRTTIKSIRPRITGDENSTILFRVGGTDNDPYATPTYDATVEFGVGEGFSVDLLVDRRYLALRIENKASAFAWQLDSFDIEWEDGGVW